ncbi:MAG: 4-phosphoerythronate dehydrogenase [Salinibacter sp.]
MPDPLTIVADENIPCVQEAFGRFGTVKTMPGHQIKRPVVRSADVLLVRSVTPVTPNLVAGSGVRFVGSATIGTDHVDRKHLAAAGIEFAHAPGSNADSVGDYVVAALLTLARRQRVSLEGRTVGIVGCGNIGGRLARRLSALGLEVLQNDPPRAETETPPPEFVSLRTVLRNADILTLHVPLTRDGAHPTHHLIGEKEVSHMQKGAWLLNTSRGPVVNPEALRTAANSGRLGGLVLDVWPEEPTPAPALVRAADIATPHIAGYAYDGKVRGTSMLYEALCRHLGVEPTWDPHAMLTPADPSVLRCTPPDPQLTRSEALHRLARQAYDVTEDDARFRSLPDRPAEERAAGFRHLRKTYPRRREFQRYSVPKAATPRALQGAVADGLRMQLTDP